MTELVPLPADNHVHTEWSWDASTGAMLESCAMATKLGLPAIAFTDHADFTDWAFPGTGRKDTPVTRVIDTHAAGGLLDLDGYLACLDRCRAAYPGLRILSGVELGKVTSSTRKADSSSPGRAGSIASLAPCTPCRSTVGCNTPQP